MIYVAGPYYSPDPAVIQHRMERVYSFMAHLMKMELHCVSPLLFHEIVKEHELPNNFAYWDKYSFNLLKRCDKMIVLCLNGWKESKGVQAEIKFCEDNGIPVEYFAGFGTLSKD